MAQYWWCRGWKLELASWLALVGALAASPGNLALAQLKPVPDNTLGAESSVIIPLDPDLPVDVINGGATRGTNLFHSFREFNIDQGRGAYFTNPAGIENILSRVTGSSRSDILGTLGVLGNANLFLINPNGIIFGPNARLDVGGSFVGTTANGIGLANGDIFSAKPEEPLPNQLLNVNPNVFFFNQTAAQTIINRSIAGSRGLEVPQNQSLLLVGGEVRLEGGQLQAPGGRVELGGLASSGNIELNVAGNDLRSSFPDEVQRADISLTNGASVNVIAGGDGDTSFGSGGSIFVNANNLEILEGSILLAGKLINMGSAGSQAGNVEINATDKVTISGVDSIANPSFPSGTDFLSSIANLENLRLSGILNLGAGDIVIYTGSLNLSEGVIAASTFLEGNSGNIQINATDSVSVNGGSILGTSTVLGQGDSGDITVKAGDTIAFEGQSAAVSVGGSLLSLFSGNSKGKGGEITIEARSLFLKNQASFVSGTLGQGDAGSITVKVSDSISLDNSFISSSVGTPSSEGNAAEINIQTQILSLTNGAEISSSTTGIGNAGRIQINASDLVNISGVSKSAFDSSALNIFGIEAFDIFGFEANLPGFSSGLFTSTGQTARGRGGEIRVNTSNLRIADGGVLSARTRNTANGGNIFVDVNNLEVTGGGQILTTAFSSGRAGNITVDAANSIILSGSDPTFFSRSAQFGPQIVDPEGPASGVFANTAASSTGDGGSIFIDPNLVVIRDGARVAVDSQGSGKGGDIFLEADTLKLDNRAAILAETASNTGGNITLQVKDLLLLRRNSQISATAGTAEASGDGGNIDIDSPFLIAVPEENSDITANAFEGRGGNIQISAQGIFGIEFRAQRSPLSDITASSEFGVEGTVQINTPNVDPSRGLANLPVQPTETEVAQACTPGSSQAQSEFVITGRGGLPPTPEEALSSDAVQVDWVSLNPEATEDNPLATSSSTKTSTPPVTETSSPVPDQIVEAQRWVVGDNSEVILTASAAPGAPHSFRPPAKCNGS